MSICVAAIRLPKSSTQDSRLSISASLREVILFSLVSCAGCTHSHTLSLSNVKFYSRMFSHKLILLSLCVHLIPQRVQYEETITVVFQASAHYRVGRHASSHFVGMESTHSRASAQVYFLRSKLSPAIISG